MNHTPTDIESIAKSIRATCPPLVQTGQGDYSRTYSPAREPWPTWLRLAGWAGWTALVAFCGFVVGLSVGG